MNASFRKPLHLANLARLTGLLATWLLAAITFGAEPAKDPYADSRQHWSLQPIQRPATPKFEDPTSAAWVRNPIDAFILARLNEAGLKPAPEATPHVLVRRMYFDLHGLPPTVEEVEESVQSAIRNPKSAIESLIDRLLTSPRYGERAGQQWLDLVRYAETEGFEYDNTVPDAWRFRDYVIRSFNEDKPFDRFVLEQLAGDEIDPDDHELLVAAGFNRLGPVRRNAGNQLVSGSRNEVLTEMTNIVGAAFLGLTVGCARCHDHKFDPILQRDYYQLEAYFAATHENNIPLASPAEVAAWKQRNDAAQVEIKKIKESIEKGERAEDRLAEAESRLPAPLPTIASVHNDAKQRTPIHVLKRGEWEQPLEPVSMRTLGVLPAPRTKQDAPTKSTPRTDLARWIVSRDNPLTARVLANRIWISHFGAGLVTTPNDFGLYGARPTHPELLDWLASELIEGGWRLKRLHRLIVTSSTYRQSSISDLGLTSASSAEPRIADSKNPSNPKSEIRNPNLVDPTNRLLWHAPRRRLEAETLRDAMLAVSGRLNLKAGGPSVIVPVDRDLVDLLYKPAQWQVTPDQREHDRRSVYLFAKRNLRLPFMEVFDQPDMLISCGRRESSTHALQALELLNGRLANELAVAFAERLVREAGKKHERQIDLAYRLATGRAPNERELRIALEFLRDQPLREIALAILNLNDFVYVD